MVFWFVQYTIESVDTTTNTVYFFFDDSGTLHRNEASGYFLYAGFVFLSRDELDIAKRKYIKANKALKVATGITGELKASKLATSHKRSLYNSMRECESLSAVVAIRNVYNYILENKKSICRYKDYILKLIIKKKLQELLNEGRLSKGDDVNIIVSIDEQLTASNGYYDLADSIYEELRHGIYNFNYGVMHNNLFDGKVKVSITYCESKNNYLIQASDILANRILTSYRTGNKKLRNIPNHTALTFP